MTRKLLIAALLLLVAPVLVVFLNRPEEKLKMGDDVPPLTLTSVVGADVKIPSPTARVVHLQFRRFAGCPICNLHMHSIIDRYEELTAVGIKEVVVFHSPKESLAPYQAKFPFDVIADPEKKLYAQFGVDENKLALLDPRAWPAMVRGISLAEKPTGDPEGGAWTRPAEFLISPFGKILAAHYGAHAFDQWSVDEILDHARR